jgi:prepilin-type N-terminal cleavage/methylation domain-containing protein
MKLMGQSGPIGRPRWKPYQGPVMQTARRAGFSLIEALVVLAIGGMALAVIFSIGIKAGDTGFSLGRRAMSVADLDISVNDVRVVIRSTVLTPARAFKVGVDSPMIGTPETLEMDVVMERANQCAPQGWAGRLKLRIESAPEGRALFCILGTRRIKLLSANTKSRFSYSTDRMNWTSDYTSSPSVNQGLEEIKSASVWVRFNGSSVDIVELATSGRPEAWIRTDEGF